MTDRSGPSLSSNWGRFFFFILFASLCSPSLGGPLSERVIFVAQVRGLKKLFICRPDGRDLQRFCRVKGEQVQASYSPALKRVFFLRRHKRKSQICSANHEGRDFRVELEKKRSKLLHPDPSPDGRTLVFCTDTWGGLELAELDLQTRKTRRLTYDQTINTFPRYSPDGGSILFQSRREGHSELFILDRASRKIRQITDTAFHKGRGSWKPDGRRVVSTERRPPKFERALFELELENQKTRYLLPGRKGALRPVYSLDGTRILFTLDGKLLVYDLSETEAKPFPLRGRLLPEEPLWISFPLP